MDGVKDNIRRITTDVNGDLWLNTEVQGLLRVHFEGDKINQVKTHRIGLEHGLPDLTAGRTIAFGKDLMLVTPKGIKSAQIAPWQEGDTDATRFTSDARFGSQFSNGSLEVSDLIDDHVGGVYLKTSDGIFAVRRKNLKDKPGKSEDQSAVPYTFDGNAFRGATSADDGLFAHPQGGVWMPSEVLTRVEPDAKKNYTQDFLALIRRVTTNGKHVIFSGSFAEHGSGIQNAATVFQTQQNKSQILQLPYEQNALIFEFSAPFFEKPGTLRFQYQLSGFDSQWSEWDSATAKEYTNIPEGQYRFKVRAKNIYGVQTPEAIYAFQILPPWYRSWWAYMLWIALAAFLIWCIAHFYSLRLKREKLRLEELVAERTQQLREASLTDPLTGLRNRRFLSEVLQNDVQAFISYKNYVLQASINRASMTGREVFALYLLDMDHFKQINDTYGHEAGDMLLKQFSQILNEAVRKDDVVVRLGGEEFLVVLKKTDPDYIHHFAQKLLKKVADTEFDLGAGVRIHKTCSIGYTVFPFYAEFPALVSFEQNVMLSDMAMYYAKHHGRNQAVFMSATAKVPASDEAIRHMVSSFEFASKQAYVTIEQVRQKNEEAAS
ncbi:diguanylate cyclase [Undibacterium sp. Ji22W]|uniref:diguanylate cyclase n=1 Tax=Undibacterium sp. Ji22W TaxID=3413038 RepID=UPI003BEFB953